MDRCFVGVNEHFDESLNSIKKRKEQRIWLEIIMANPMPYLHPELERRISLETAEIRGIWVSCARAILNGVI
jgi:hypothetical protein